MGLHISNENCFCPPNEGDIAAWEDALNRGVFTTEDEKAKERAQWQAEIDRRCDGCEGPYQDPNTYEVKCKSGADIKAGKVVTEVLVDMMEPLEVPVHGPVPGLETKLGRRMASGDLDVL